MSRLDSLRHQMESQSEDARFAACLTLYRAEESSESDLVDERESLFLRKDPLLKISFARFLSRMEEKRAIQMLVSLIDTDNPQVFEAATKAFLRNQYKDKLYLLVPLISSSFEKIQVFALDQLSSARVEAALIPILQLLDKKEQLSVERLYALLSALRHYPDTKIIPYVQALIHDPREEVRFRIVLILGSLNAARLLSDESFLLEALNDPSKKIRKAALWALRRRPSLKHLPALKNSSLHDPEATVREEALLELVSFPTKPVVYHLLKVLTEDQNRMVTLKSETVLLSMPTRKVVSVLNRLLSKDLSLDDEKIYCRALACLAEFETGSDRLLRYVQKQIEKRQLGPEKSLVAYFEVLELLDHPGALPFLKTFLSKTPLLSYVALKAILKISRHHAGDEDLIKYLKDPYFPVLHKQMVLNFYIKGRLQSASVSFVESQKTELEKVLLTLVDHENINIRYLSFQALKALGLKSLISYSLKHFFEEADPAVLKVLSDYLASQLSDDFESWKRTVFEFQDEEKVVLYLFQIFKPTQKFSDTSNEQFLNFTLELFRMGSRQIKQSLTSLLFTQLVSGKSSWGALFDFMEKHSDSWGILIFLSENAQQQERRFNVPLLRIETFLGRHSADMDVEIQRALLNLSTFDQEERNIPLAVHVFSSTPHEALKKDSLRIMQSIIAESVP